MVWTQHLISPLSNQEREASEPGYALQQAHRRKVSQIGEACRSEGIEFAPLAVEVLGGWSTSAATHLKKLGKAQAGRAGRPQAELISQLFQKLSILLVRDNAALLLSRQP